MDESTLRRLAIELLTELPTEIPDPAERDPVADAITTALGVPVGAGRLRLLGALSSHEATRRWMLAHGAASEDVIRAVGLAGDPSTPLGLYYMCPKEHEDTVLHSVPAWPPLCSKCGAPMDLM
ncbi:MAG: hypothetical protein JO281_00905 [Pseudonocardiales bacterium]|nr:hypothetical protein [Pseudonocardiales bacterium]